MILRNINIVALGFQIMFNMTRPIIPLYALTMGANTMEIGILIAVYSFFPLIFAIRIGKITDHVGNRLPVIWGVAGIAAGLSFPFFFPTMWSLYVSQVIVGISHIFTQVSMQNVLGNAATEQNRDHYFNNFSMMIALGGVIGPVAGGYLGEHISYPFAFLISALLGLIPFLYAFKIPEIHNRVEKDKSSSSSLTLLKIPVIRKALASSALVLYSRDIFIAYFPLFANHLGVSTSSIGWIIATQGMTMMGVRFFLVRMTDAFGRQSILFMSILLAGISFLLIPTTSYVSIFFLLSALMGAGLGCGQPLSLTTTYNASPPSRTGEVFGLRLASNRLSQLLAPALFGLVGAWGGLMSVFVVSGSLLIGGAFLTTERKNKKAHS